MNARVFMYVCIYTYIHECILGKKKGANNLKCKAAIGGGQTCEGSKEVEFTKAFDTKDGARTKVTGDANKVSTYFSQIDAGYKTLVELAGITFVSFFFHSFLAFDSEHSSLRLGSYLAIYLVCMYVCMYVCMHACMHICTYLCMGTCMCEYI